MSTPLSPWERNDIAYRAPEQIDPYELLGRYELTVRREEERALAAEARVRALEEALSEALGRA